MISLDVDGVLLNYMGKIIDIINSTNNYAKNPISIDQFTSWDYIVKRCPTVEVLFTKPEIYNLVDPFEGAKEFMETIISKYGPENIQIVTSSHGKILKAKNNKLKEVFGFINGFNQIPVKHVGLIEEGKHDKSKYTTNTILVDDAPHNIIDHLENNSNDYGIIVDFNYNWTKGLEDIVDNSRLFRAKSYDDILNGIDILQEKKLENEFSKMIAI